LAGSIGIRRSHAHLPPFASTEVCTKGFQLLSFLGIDNWITEVEPFHCFDDGGYDKKAAEPFVIRRYDIPWCMF